MTKVINDSEFMTVIDIEGFQYQHQLHLGSTYKGYWVNMHKMYDMENAHMINLCQNRIRFWILHYVIVLGMTLIYLKLQSSLVQCATINI